MNFVSIIATLLSLTFITATQAQAATEDSGSIEQDTDIPPPSYWLRYQEGWFWYKDPSLPTAKKEMKKETRPRELIEFEAMQKHLEQLKKIAVMNPTEMHMKAYMGYQRFVMDKSALFADKWQRVVWQTPELDYSLTGRPTNGFAIDVYDQQLRDKQSNTLRALARTHGLFFFFRSDCPYCHKFAPVLRRFSEQYGLLVLPVSLDGGVLPDFPNAVTDNGIAASLNVTVVPALFLAVPGSRQMTPIGFGLMAETELVERMHTLTQTPSQTYQ